MPALANPKHEAFAQAIANGESNAQAYRLAGYKAKTAQVASAAGGKLRQRDDVSARINEILESRAAISAKAEAIAVTRAVEQQVVSKEKIIRELARIGFADLRKAVEWGTREVRLTTEAERDAGYMDDVVITHKITLVDSTLLDDDTAAAITEVKQGRDGQVSIKMADKRAALMDLAKIMGMVVDRKEIGAPGEFDDKSDEELAAIVAGKASAVGERGTTH